MKLGHPDLTHCKQLKVIQVKLITFWAFEIKMVEFH